MLTRREALLAVGAVAMVLHGREATAQTGVRNIVLPLDGIGSVVLQLRGQSVPVPVQDIFDALKGVK